jgi:hypothetical protein
VPLSPNAAAPAETRFRSSFFNFSAIVGRTSGVPQTRSQQEGLFTLLLLIIAETLLSDKFLERQRQRQGYAARLQ